MEDAAEIIFAGICLILAGAFSLLGAIMNWEWFFRARKSAMINTLLGRTGARIFYGVLGVAILVGGIWFMIYSFVS